MTKIYEASATREGRWWIIRVHDLDNAVTQARRAREIDEMAAGLVQALLDLDEPPEVNVTLKLPDDVVADWTEAADLQRRSDEDEERAGSLRRGVVRHLLEKGWSQYDISATLGVSHQRVQQLSRSEKTTAASS